MENGPILLLKNKYTVFHDISKDLVFPRHLNDAGRGVIRV